MSLKNLLKARLNQQFIDANLKGASRLAPRNGFYFIKEVNFCSVGLHGEIPVAKANWKSKETDWFFEDVTVEIAVVSLFPKVGIDFSHILGKPLEIYDAKFVERSIKGEMCKVIDCQWALSSPNHQFTTSQSAVLSAFLDNTKSLMEAWGKFESDLVIDLSDALQWEATFGEVYDEPTNDDEVYDAPEDDEVN